MSRFDRLIVWFLTAGIVARLTSTPATAAATVYWDPNGTHGAGGGAGAWNLSDSFWASAISGGTNAAWVDGDDAVFGGTVGEVALNSSVKVGNLSFTSLRYFLNTGDGIDLTITRGITANIDTTRAMNTIQGTGRVVMDGDQTIDLTNGINIKAVLSGSGTITKTGTGSVGLSASNTYTGKYVVTGGMLGISSDAALGIAPSTFQADNITLNGGFLLAGGVLSGPGNFDNPGSFALSANRGITLGANGGSIRVGYGVDCTMTVNGVISGVGTFTKTDGGVLVLAADNTYEGATFVNGGTLQLGDGGTKGSINTLKITIGAGNGNGLTINRSDSYVLTNDIDMLGRANMGVAAGQTATLTGALTGIGEFWKQGGGTLIVASNANSNRAANTVIVAGTLQVADLSRSATSPLGSGIIVLGQGSTPSTGAGISYTGDSVTTDILTSVKSNFTFIEVTQATTTLTLTASFGGAYVTKRGDGTLSLSGINDNTKLRFQVDAGTLLLDKGGLPTAHAVAGAEALVMNAGIVRITGSNGDQIYDSSTLQMNGGTLDLNGHDEAFDGFTATGTAVVITNNLSGGQSKLSLGVNNGSSTFNGSIQDGAGTLALEKKGTGSLTLKGDNMVTGTTILSAGRLIVDGHLTGSLTQVSGGTLGGKGTVGDVTVFGGTVAPGATAAGAAIGTLHTGSLDLSGNGTLEVAISTSTLEASLIEIEGNLTLGFSAGLLSLSDVGAATPLTVGTTFTIMSYTGTWDGETFLFGMLGSIDNGSTFDFGPNTYRIEYDATGAVPDDRYVTLTVTASVPEPAAPGLMLGGVALLGCWRRWRRRV